MLQVVKDCRVYFRDRQGVEHGVPVCAINRYHAFGLGWHALSNCSWSNPNLGGVESLTIEIFEIAKQKKPARIRVTRAEFENWLAKEPPQPGDVREYLMMLLKRIPPSRDFKNGVKAR